MIAGWLKMVELRLQFSTMLASRSSYRHGLPLVLRRPERTGMKAVDWIPTRQLIDWDFGTPASHPKESLATTLGRTRFSAK
jgi:hypothetical protein